MKKTLLTIIIFLGMFAASNAQVFKEYLAKEGLETALAQAINEGLTSPVLYFIATSSDKSDNMPEALTPKVDMSTGAATVWLYHFRENSDSNQRVFVAVVKTVIFSIETFLPMTLGEGELFAELPGLTKPLPGTQWANSDSLMIVLNENEIVSNFRKAFADARIRNTIIGMNTFNPMFEMDTPYWLTMLSATGSESTIECFTNAKNGDTECFDYVSVEETAQDQMLRIYPNPASHILMVEIPELWSNKELNIAIYHYSGMEVSNNTHKSASRNIIIPLNFLQNGEYIISISDGKSRLEKLFVVSK